ncbi:hypothetical protein C7293_08295 [filamentous cyanobacterium CCT1]|nr:hypothetical protein C7293_08295 [filamentous cyanobacterium CCT1]PSN80727.1 hypothetical protein C8B47_05105 [filamentous cyanobacterium CCP4]
MELRLLVENAVFFGIATAFLAITGWAWRHIAPFDLPKPLPGWFKYWFGSVQVLGIVPPLGALVWAIWHNEPAVWMVFAAYFVLLGLQILSELLTLKQLHSVVWVMVPYLYVPYRLWQLYEGIDLTAGRPELAWIQLILAAEIVVWGINYLLDLAQLPRLFRWQ